MNNIISILEPTINYDNNNYIKYVGEIKINEHNELFLEHFPEMPIVPGAATVSIILSSITEVILKLKNYSYYCIRMEKITFLKAITPKLCDLRLEYKCMDTNDNDEIIAQSLIVDSNKNTYFRGVFIFTKKVRS